MQKKKLFLAYLTVMLVVLLASCNMPSAQQTATQSPEEIETSVAQTVTANAENGEPPTETPKPEDTEIPQASNTPTLEPSNTPISTETPTPTNTPVPCNRAQFVTDVTIPDGTDLTPGETFEKTWRLQNTGSCDWTSGYDIVFSSGDAMGAPSAVQITSDIVPTGSTVDVSVTLTAPDDPGTYRGNWKLRDSADQIFGIVSTGEFWVEIEVVAPTDTPEPTPTDTATPDPKPDLIINLFELNPATPIQGAPVDVKIQVYNDGNAIAGAFRVEWYGGVNFSTPSCAWNLTPLVARGGRVLTCTYTYGSWYGSIDTVVYADVNDTVDESDESNNNAMMTISVNQP